MSIHLHPRPRPLCQSTRRTRTTPTPTRPASLAPFRWSAPGPHTQPRRPRAALVTDPNRPDLPDPGPWAATLARAIVEVVTGVRTSHQLRRWLLPDLYAALIEVHLTPCARGTTPIHVRVCTIDAQHTEAAVIVATATRTRLIAHSTNTQQSEGTPAGAPSPDRSTTATLLSGRATLRAITARRR